MSPIYEKLPESPATKPDLAGLRIKIEGVRATEKIGYTISADVYSKLEKDMDYLMPDVGYYLLSLGSYSRIRRTGRAVYRIYDKEGRLVSKKSHSFTYGYACVGPTLLGTIWASKSSSTYYPAIRQYVGINAAYRLAEELAELKAKGNK